MPWTPDELDTFGSPEELRITARREDGSAATTVPIWAVRVGDELFARSWKGERGAWYRYARVTGRARIETGASAKDVMLAADADHDDEVDAAYRAKYGDTQYVREMIDEPAHGTTMRLDPA